MKTEDKIYLLKHRMNFTYGKLGHYSKQRDRRWYKRQYNKLQKLKGKLRKENSK